MRVTTTPVYDVDVLLHDENFRWHCEFGTEPTGRALAAVLEYEIDDGLEVTPERQDLRDALAFVDNLPMPEVGDIANTDIRVAGVVVGQVVVGRRRSVYTVKERRGREPQVVTS